MIYFNGRVGICCVDFNNLANLPSIEDRGLFETLYGPQVLAARRAGCRREHALCRDCQSAGATFRGFRLDLDRLRAVADGGGGLPDWAGLVAGELQEIDAHAAG